ncbi:MAG: ABC transporter ATP-binding protein [Phycisphaerales bacterium JB043]
MRKHRAFWNLARGMLEHKLLLAGVLVAALVSASGLGAGLLAMVPVLRILLDRTNTQTLSQFIAEKTSSWQIQIPQSWLDALPTDPFQAIVAVLVFIVVLTFFGAGANFLHRYLSLTLTAVRVAQIRQEIFAKTIRLSLARLHNGVSEAQSRLINDTDLLRFGFDQLTSKFVAQVLKGMVAFVAALLIDWQITLWALLVLPPMAIMLKKLGKRVRRASDRLLHARSGLLGLSGETFGGMRAIKSCNAEAQREDAFDEINREALHQEMRARTALALSSPITEGLMVIVLAVLAIFASRMILRGSLRPDEFLMTLAALAAAGGALKPVSSLWQSLQMSDAAARRIIEVLETPDEVAHGGGESLRAPQQQIVLDGVTFTYEGALEPSVRNVSLTIPVGTTVAFVGPNGSGKTTLLSLLPRFFEPDAGEILFDEQRLREMELRSVREQIGVVSQDVVLFTGTIRDNITLGSPDAREERIRHAIEGAHAEDLIELKGGLEAHVGEGGVALSGGQRQRLSIARALLRDPSVLILDEATSMIDADSEQRIAEAVRDFSRDRTCLIIAHRLSTVQHADMIVVIDEGRIVDTGTHNELLGSCELYQRLVAGQLVSINA